MLSTGEIITAVYAVVGIIILVVGRRLEDD